jgi:hypothetical protein
MGGTARTAVQLPEAPASVRRSGPKPPSGGTPFALSARPEREAPAAIENRPTRNSSSLLEAAAIGLEILAAACYAGLRGKKRREGHADGSETMPRLRCYCARRQIVPFISLLARDPRRQRRPHCRRPAPRCPGSRSPGPSPSGARRRDEPRGVGRFVSARRSFGWPNLLHPPVGAFVPTSLAGANRP